MYVFAYIYTNDKNRRLLCYPSIRKRGQITIFPNQYQKKNTIIQNSRTMTTIPNSEKKTHKKHFHIFRPRQRRKTLRYRNFATTKRETCFTRRTFHRIRFLSLVENIPFREKFRIKILFSNKSEYDGGKMVGKRCTKNEPAESL